MRIKKYQNWKLTNTNIHSHKLNSSIHQTSFSISQLLSTPKHYHQNNEDHLHPKTISSFANLNKKLANKAQIHLNKSNNNLIIKAQQKTQREQLIKSKIKSRLKQQYMNESFNIKTNRTFFATNPIKQNYDHLALSFDRLIDYQLSPKNISVQVKGKSLPFTSLSRARSKSTVIRTGPINSTQKYKLHKPQKYKLNWHNSAKKTLFSGELKRQNSLNLQIHKKVPQYSVKTTFIKDIDPWEINNQLEGLWP